MYDHYSSLFRQGCWRPQPRRNGKIGRIPSSERWFMTQLSKTPVLFFIAAPEKQPDGAVGSRPKVPRQVEISLTAPFSLSLTALRNVWACPQVLSHARTMPRFPPLLIASPLSVRCVTRWLIIDSSTRWVMHAQDICWFPISAAYGIWSGGPNDQEVAEGEANPTVSPKQTKRDPSQQCQKG